MKEEKYITNPRYTACPIQAFFLLQTVCPKSMKNLKMAIKHQTKDQMSSLLDQWTSFDHINNQLVIYHMGQNCFKKLPFCHSKLK